MDSNTAISQICILTIHSPFLQYQLFSGANTSICTVTAWTDRNSGRHKYKHFFFKPVWFHSPDARHGSPSHTSTAEEVMWRPRKEREAVTSKGSITARLCNIKPQPQRHWHQGRRCFHHCLTAQQLTSSGNSTVCQAGLWTRNAKLKQHMLEISFSLVLEIFSNSVEGRRRDV